MESREKMHERDLVILLVLTNATADTQEMDQAYSYFKQECDVSTHCIAYMKVGARV